VIDANLSSAFLNIASKPTTDDEIRITGWGQRTRDAAPNHLAFGRPSAGEQDTGLHLQAAWQHGAANADAGVRLFGSYTMGRRATDLVAPSVIVVERLTDGPVPSLVDPNVGTDRVWSIGARVNRTFSPAPDVRHTVLAGVDFSGASASVRSAFTGRVGELVDGLPARVWDFTVPLAGSDWRSSSLSLFVSDTAAIAPWLTVNGGLRFEALSGSTESASNESVGAICAARGRAPGHDRFLEARGVRSVRPLRGSAAARRSRVRRPERADGDDVSMERDERRSAAAERDRSARAAMGTGHRRRFRRSPPSIQRSSVL